METLVAPRQGAGVQDYHFLSCSSKKAYHHKPVARNVVRQARKQGITLYLYRCDYMLCGEHWHVSKKKAIA